MDSGCTGFSEKRGASLLCSGGSVSCSVCLEAVTDKGGRSIAKLKCGHDFHLDCIGSAFNAKGAMQCPNCRHVENGQWLYANGCRPYEEFTVEDWANDEDLYDVNYTEMPFGFQWCPYQGSFSQLSLSMEEIDPPPEPYSNPIVNALYGEHSNASTGAHVCPYLAVHGISRSRQFPVPSNNRTASTNPPDISVHHRNVASGTGDVFGSHAFPTVDTHHHNWRTSATFPTSNSAVNSSDPTTPASPSSERLRLRRTDSDVLQRTGSFMRFGYTSHGSYPRTFHGSVPPVMTTDFGHSHNHIHAHGGSHVYQPQAAASPLQNGLTTHSRRSHPRGISLISPRSVVRNAPAEQGQIRRPFMYASMSRNSQDGDSIGWHQGHRFYGWEREGFSSVPWFPVDQDSQQWASFHLGQNPQNVSAESVNRNYHHPHSYVGAERSPQGRPGMSMDNSYQRHVYPRFPPSFP